MACCRWVDDVDCMLVCICLQRKGMRNSMVERDVQRCTSIRNLDLHCCELFHAMPAAQ
jgi:hypothetical protein